MSDLIQLDKRLQEKSIRDGKLSRQALADAMTALPDTIASAVEFDEDGNPTNVPDRTLKTLDIKMSEPEPKIPQTLESLGDIWLDQ